MDYSQCQSAGGSRLLQELVAFDPQSSAEVLMRLGS